MVQVGCTINYGRKCLWKKRKKCYVGQPPSSVRRATLDGVAGALTIWGTSARIRKAVHDGQPLVSPNNGPVAQLGARFHGMEEVVGSIPTRSTIFSITYERPDQSVGVIWCQNALTSSKLRSGQPPVHHACFLLPHRRRSLPQLLIDGIDRRPYALRNLLHIHIRSGCRARVPEHALHVLHRALLLRQRGNCAPYDLEGELWELQLCREFVQHALAIVAGVNKVTVLVREDERFGRWIRTLLFPAPEISGQLPGNMNNPETLSGFAPRADLAHVGGFAHAHVGFCEVEAFPSERKQFARTEGISHVQFQ